MATSQVCANCYQGVTNPVCEKCHTKQLALWLDDHEVDPKLISHIIRRIRKIPALENPEYMPCIICNIEAVSLCTYCYFFKVEKILRSLNLPEEMIDHFLQIFNYKLYNSVFSREED